MLPDFAVLRYEAFVGKCAYTQQERMSVVFLSLQAYDDSIAFGPGFSDELYHLLELFGSHSISLENGVTSSSLIS